MHTLSAVHGPLNASVRRGVRIRFVLPWFDIIRPQAQQINTRSSMRGYRRIIAKLDHFLKRLIREQPMTAQRRNAWQKIRASGFRKFMWRRVLVSIGVGMIVWGIIGLFGYGLE